MSIIVFRIPRFLAISQERVTLLKIDLTEVPHTGPRTFLNFLLALDLDVLDAHIAILGVPFGMPYCPSEMTNDQSRAPDAIRQLSKFAYDVTNNFDWDSRLKRSSKESTSVFCLLKRPHLKTNGASDEDLQLIER